VLFGEVLDGPAAERVGLAYRCVDDDALADVAHAMAAKAAEVPRELSITTKRTLGDMAGIGAHDEAVDREIEPQIWSTRQPWFRERLAALQARISKKS
jgi:enoyl-CoA hydratase